MRFAPLSFIKIVTLSMVAGSWTPGSTLGQDSLDAAIPLDPLVRSGTLSNGLTFYVRENSKPANRLEMRLVVNAGSLQEDDDQLGLAHFVEHMLFNGTRRFPRQSLVEFFEQIGMRFGPDINAYTSFDATVFQLQVPTDSLPVVHAAFEVLQDWARDATLDPHEIEKERGVLVEEWRHGRGAAGRVRDQLLAMLFAGSRYADRLPIGDTLSLERSPAAAIERYYRTWYRPELMTIVLVGDLSADQMEGWVREYFGYLTNPPDARPRIEYRLSPGSTVQHQVIVDPEATTTAFTVYYRQPYATNSTLRAYRGLVLSRLATGMLNRRLAVIARNGLQSPFLWARLTRSTLVRLHTAYTLSGQVDEDSLLQGLEAALRELHRAIELGFTTSELERQKQVLLRSRERAHQERDHTLSSRLAQQLVHHQLGGSPVPGSERELAMMQKMLAGISAAEVHQYLRSKTATENQLIVVSMPDKAGLTPPDSRMLQEAARRAREATLTPYEDIADDEPLLSALPSSADVLQTREDSAAGITEFTMSNGVHIVVKPTQFKSDEVLFTAFGIGGTSLYSDEEYFDATLASLVVQRSGAGDFPQSVLRQKLAGKNVQVAPFVTEHTQGFNGRASATDLETLFQLIHLYATTPRADTTALQSLKNHQRSQLINRQADPATAFSDALFRAFYGDHKRRRLLTTGDIDRLSAQRSLKIYRDRFADFADFTFIFVGNIDTGTLLTLAQTYLGTLPSLSRAESWRDVEPELPQGIVKKEVYKGSEPKSRVGIVFHGPIDYSFASAHRLQSLGMVLDIRIREELREALGGIYSASVQAGAVRIPRPSYTISLYFGCAPDRVREMTSAVFSIVDSLREAAPSPALVTRVQAQQRQAHREQLETNEFWLSALQNAWFHGESLDSVLQYEPLVDALSPADVQAAARSWLGDRYIQVTLWPAKE